MKIFQSIVFLIFTLVLPAAGQILEPVKWTFASEQLSETEHNLVFTAHIDDGWTVYSQFTSDDGPVPTLLTFEDIQGAELNGKATEKGHKKEGMDKLFEVNVIKFLSDENFVITQKVTVSDYSKPIAGYLTFMTCDNKACLPPADIDFSFNLKNTLGSGGSDEANSTSASSSIETEQKEESTKDAALSEDKITVSFANGVADQEEEQKDEKPSGIFQPVTWDISKKQLSDDEYELIFNASIDEGWAVYSIYLEEGGPIPTSITYENAEGVEMIGKAIEEGHKKEGPDPMWKDDVDVVIKFLDDQDYTIKQKVKITDPTKPFTGYLTFMTCDDKRCLNPTDVDFDFGFGSVVNDIASINFNADGKIDQSRAPIVETYDNPLSDCGKDETKDSNSVLWLLIAGMLGGFAALLTPCVFPMIPITVSFFTKDTKRSGLMNGLIYGLSIIIIYVILGLIITVTLGPEALQALSTNWIANTIFFLIFIFFAGSFFGYYELTLPSSWTTKSDQMADKGGLIGIFFMAATLALVSFSCTGPIVGSALVAAAEGGFVGPLVVMFGFSFALALPFGLFAAFPAWLNSLPRSGGWMNSVKVVLGFLELGFAFKFLSTADLTQHWGILKYETFMFILVAVSVSIAIYLFGFIKFPHDSPIKKLSMPRKLIASSFVGLAIYLGFGFTINKDTGIYNSLWLTSGFSPPVMYNMFLDKGEVDPEIKKRFPSFSKCANNIDCFKDYYEGMAYAKEVGKPAFIDFTGHGCQNCRRTEDNIWVDDNVRAILNDEVVLISLYTDDREPLEETFISAKDDKKIRNVGRKWADFQVVNFDQNSQPLYIMVTPEEEVITHPRGYEDGIKSYETYLNCGLDYYQSK
ncbi:MAG: cytochrome c biogenesis protein CcdA [Saprospiraceae bacterium]|nr:cytochrome c biogenesis protein CcdA [Saprospiraceae bacterium]